MSLPASYVVKYQIDIYDYCLPKDIRRNRELNPKHLHERPLLFHWATAAYVVSTNAPVTQFEHKTNYKNFFRHVERTSPSMKHSSAFDNVFNVFLICILGVDDQLFLILLSVPHIQETGLVVRRICGKHDQAFAWWDSSSLVIFNMNLNGFVGRSYFTVTE